MSASVITNEWPSDVAAVRSPKPVVVSVDEAEVQKVGLIADS